MKVYLDKQCFCYPLFFFVFGNANHAEIAVMMMIGGFSPDSGSRKRLTLTTSVRIHSSNVDLMWNYTAKMWGSRFIWVTHLHAKICLIGFEEFCSWYYFVLHLPWIDVATNVAETVRTNFAESF